MKKILLGLPPSNPLLILILAAASWSCSDPTPQAVDLGTYRVESLSNPSGPGAMAPSLSASKSQIILSWLEPGTLADLGPTASDSEVQQGEQPKKIWSAKTSVLGNGGFSPPSEVVTGTDFFANWADFPSVARHPSGAMVTHQLRKLGLGTYAYGVHLSVATGDGWNQLGLLHDDRSLTEHGFVSYTADGDQLRAFWLDGREMAVEGPMTLRTTLIPSKRVVQAATAGIEMASITVGTPLASEALDHRVCECCATDAATTSQGPVVVYRDRSAKEIRDIAIVRWSEDGWTEPQLIHRDGWMIEGCPVNGPSVAAIGDLVAVAWFTAANDEPRVQLAISRDGGSHFQKPILIHDQKSQGRVDLVLATTPAASRASESDRTPAPAIDVWVTHLGQPPGQDQPATTDGGIAVLLDHLRIQGDSVDRGSTTVVAASSQARASGFPRMAHDGSNLHLAWVDSSSPSRVLTARLVEQ